MAGAGMRVGHYAINWLLIIMTGLHFSRAVNEDFLIGLEFFGFKKYTAEKLVAHGHGHDEESHAPVVAAVETE